jgi:hypothetical protein
VTPATRDVFRLLPHSKVDGMPLVVGIHPDGTLSIRLSGHRTVYTIPAVTVYEYARRNEGRARKARLKAARIARKLERQWRAMPEDGASPETTARIFANLPDDIPWRNEQ